MAHIKGTATAIVDRRIGKVKYKSKYKDGSLYGYVTTGAARYQQVERSGQVDITVDVDRLLARLGASALANKSGYATGLGGIIKARVTGKVTERVTRDTSFDKVHEGENIEVLSREE